MTNLPDTNDSVGDKDKEDNEGLHEGCDRVIVFKERQNLRK